jgi:hypothetical protein
MGQVHFTYQPGYLASANTQAANQERNRVSAELILSKLIEAGLTQTSDTGQYDPSTTPFSYPSSVSAKAHAGYWIFELEDSLSASKRLFIRMDLYAGSCGPHGITSADVWIDLMIGTGTDGAGNLIQPVSVSLTSRSYNVPATRSLTYSAAISVEDGMFKFALGIESILTTSSGYVLQGLALVSRTRNSDGTPNADGFFGIGINSTTYQSNPLVVSSLLGVAPGGSYRELISAVGVLASSEPADGNIQVQYPYVLNPELQTTYEFAYTVTALPANSFITVDVGGTSIRYLSLGRICDSPTNCLGGPANFNGVSSTVLAGMSLLLRWDEE